jgi:hypothetical protein
MYLRAVAPSQSDVSAAARLVAMIEHFSYQPALIRVANLTLSP